MMPNTYSQRRQNRAISRFSWTKLGWFTFYGAALQWVLVLFLCLFKQGGLVTAYYTPVLAFLRLVTPTGWLRQPTLQLGMIWTLACLFLYGVVFALIMMGMANRRS